MAGSAQIGGILGATVGGIAGYRSGTDPPCDPDGMFLGCLGYVRVTATEKAVMLGAVSAGAGLAVGALIGYFVGSSRYDDYVFF